ncbi:MAG: hypothetical protein GY832_13160, partial [Chloroflexi bacterium]|nr:hypothetical protein [Chloroflexota bacterium]
TFTISPSFAFPWRARAIPLDASLSPAMRVEVQVIWEYLTEQQGIELPLLPRRAGWYLVAQEQLRKKDKKTRQ